MNEKRLRIKEKKFVKAVVKHGNQSLAVKEAGYNTQHPARLGNQIAKRPHVQRAIEMELEKAMGNVEELVSETLKTILTDPGATYRDKLAAISAVAKLKGLEAPKRSEVLRADVTKRLLPSED